MTNGMGDDSKWQARNRLVPAPHGPSWRAGHRLDYPAFRIGNLGRSFTDCEG
jgi:hypothetical protein